MPARLKVIVLFWALLALHSAVDAQRPDAIRRAGRGRARIPNQYIVALKPDFDPEAVGIELANVGRGRLKHVYRRALNGFSVRLNDVQATALAADPRVEYVAEDVNISAAATLSGAPWNLDRIDQRDRPYDTDYTYMDDGTGVNVYVVDSGVRVTHEQFGGRAFFGGEFADDDLNPATDLHNDDGDPAHPDGTDCNGHGTHVAGIVGAQRYGVAKNVTIWSYRALRCTGDGQGTDVLAAVDAVIADHRSPAVLNLSLGGWGFTPLDDAVRRAIAEGITVVIAAGNDGAAITSQTPADVRDAIVVGASTFTDDRASYSNFGPLLDLFAPGDSVPSTWYTSDTDSWTLSGTSMAAPHVAGAAALYLQTHPWASPGEVRDALVAQATPGRLTNIGTGSPNLLLFTAFQAPPTPQIDISPDPITFGTYRVGTTSPSQTVLVSNRGGAPMTVSDVALVGPAPGDFGKTSDSCTGQSVEPGSACALQMVFVPTGGGTRSAQLRVTTNVHDSPTFVAMSGTGLYSNGTYLPSPWTSVDIGPVGLSGGAWFADKTFTVSGAGSDIWGSADSFQFTYEPLHADGTIVARVASLSGNNAWTKAGVMIRETLQPESAHALMLVSAAKGLAYQRRTTTGGSTLNTAAGTGTAPAWVKLSRVGQVITASVSSDGATWTVVGKNTFAMATDVFVGFAVTNHSTSALATARIDNVSVSTADSSALLPSGWSTGDVGSTGVAGSATESGGTFTVKGGGADIWGSADAFRFAWRSLSGDGTITARLSSLSGTQAWTKSGVMIRESLAPGSAHALMLVSIGKGLAFQRRTTTNGLTTSTSGGTGTAPRWVRLKRSGQVITASVSTDGATWTTVAQDTFAMASNVLVGLVTSSHDTTSLATSTFDNVSITTPASALPAGWASRDIGSTGVTGSASASGGTFTVKGGGADIWGSADAFRYAYRALSGDGAMTARVASLSGTLAWTKAGVMIRESLTAGSAHALMLVSVGKGTAFQRRTATNGLTTSTAGPAVTAPRWVRLTRSGQTITAFVSPDGASWTLVGQDTFAMAADVWVGLAVSSHDTTALATATFDQVQ